MTAIATAVATAVVDCDCGYELRWWCSWLLRWRQRRSKVVVGVVTCAEKRTEDAGLHTRGGWAVAPVGTSWWHGPKFMETEDGCSAGTRA